MEKIKETAFTPAQALQYKEEKVIHPGIFEIVNEMLAEQYDGGKYGVTLMQPEIIKRFLEKYPDIERETIFEKNWLDFEKIYKKRGWKVEYDKPAYCETYDPSFKFIPIKLK